LKSDFTLYQEDLREDLKEIKEAIRANGEAIQEINRYLRNQIFFRGDRE